MCGTTGGGGSSSSSSSSSGSGSGSSGGSSTRKFRGQIPDSMDTWKSRGGKNEGREEERRERKKMQVRENVEKSRNTVFVQRFVSPKGQKVGSLKRRVRSHVVR